MAQNTYLGAHWRGRRQWDGLLYSGFSYVNASPSLPAANGHVIGDVHRVPLRQAKVSAHGT